jgi:putative membrane-bound dehydrogenase-like protein
MEKLRRFVRMIFAEAFYGNIDRQAACTVVPATIHSDAGETMRNDHRFGPSKIRLFAPLAFVMFTGVGIAGEAPLNPQQAAKEAVVPPGFHVTLVAAEPDVRQPISFCIDDRGRLWVAEAYNYPNRNAPPKDRVLILEDTNGDGKADRSTVFYDKLNYVTGIEVGFGGVWIMSPPNLLFIPDRNGDDKPDGRPQVLLNGFGTKQSAHNIANGFTWGPDGWLYAGHGRTSPSDVGKPGTPSSERMHFDGGVYRYHPTRHVFEAFCDGTTNPWGVDFDDYGEAFISNCVNPHLYHAIQGGHYEPWRGRKSSRYAYERLPTIADHLHWKDGKAGDKKRGYLPTLFTDGGGHAHCGILIYLGDNWPGRYRNAALMCNVHGRRINHDSLKRSGSSYTASHRRDVFQAKDPWFKGVTLRTGPDGAVFVSDWSDTGECHDYKNTHRETGRMFKIAFGTPKPVKVDVAKLSDSRLVALQLHRNDWYVRHARRVLQERAAAEKDMTAVHKSLRRMFETNRDVTRKLRALWALHVTAGADAAFLRRQLDHPSEYVRAWSVRLLCERGKPSSEVLAKFAIMGEKDPSPFVRLHLASALQRLPLEDRWPIAGKLAARGEDARDRFLPLMTWYAIEPLVAADTAHALRQLRKVKVPLIRQFIARRIAEGKSQ